MEKSENKSPCSMGFGVSSYRLEITERPDGEKVILVEYGLCRIKDEARLVLFRSSATSALAGLEDKIAAMPDSEVNLEFEKLKRCYVKTTTIPK